LVPHNPKHELDENSFQDIVENSRLISDTASDAIITINEDSIMLFVNHAAEDIFGYSKQEMLGAELTMLMPEYLRHLHRTGIQNYLETGHKHISWQAVELPGLHKTGAEISLELSFGEFQRNGKRFFTGIARDITKRKQTEKRLALQHSVADILANAANLDEAGPQLLKTICLNLGWQVGALWRVNTTSQDLRLVSYWRAQSTAPDQFVVTTRESRFVSGVGFPGKIWATKQFIWVPDFAVDSFPRSTAAADDNLHGAFGFPIILAGEVLGVVELFSQQIREADPSIQNTLTAIVNQIAQYIERKNREVELAQALAQAHEAHDKAEQLAKQLLALQRMADATLAHLSVEDVLAESLSRIRDILNVDTVAILLLETEGDELVAWAAQGLEEEVESGVRIPVGQGFAGKVVADLRPLIIDDIDHADVFNPLLRQKGIKSLLGVPLLLEGRPMGVLHVGKLTSAQFTAAHVQLLELAADRIALAIENARLYEVERKARAEAEEANRAKDEFLTILSHELRTPLTPIIGWVHMMQAGILPEDEFVRVLSVINRNAYSLKRLINDLLDMSAILSGKMRIEKTSVSLPAVLKESVETMRPAAEDAKVNLDLNIPEHASDISVTGDRNRLNQAFCNILHNAIKFSYPGATVQVACEATDSKALIHFSDQGEGIPTDFLPHVFERFRQADASRTRAFGGLGLGLALVKSFVEAHHGTVEANSAGPGKGSDFVVTLPKEVSEETATQVHKRKDSKKTPIKTRVLIVEDETDTLDMLSASCEARGYVVRRARSAAEALEIASREDFDIMISDIGMPEMDGIQLLHELLQLPGRDQLRAIALSGYASQKDVAESLAAGFSLHLSKPVDPAELAQAVENLLLFSNEDLPEIG
jgi:PAS domain S-box-containing protein